jgi:hypothetical protein
MRIPVLMVTAIIFTVWLKYEIRKSDQHSKSTHDDFWNAEKNANLTRSKNISNLSYITIPLDQIPMSDRDDDTLNSYRDIIRDLSSQKILNLTGLSNTELKLQYGAANLNFLSTCDNNYTRMVSMLQKWAERLYSQNYICDAASILEFAVSCKTDVRHTYLLLATIYGKQNTPEKIDSLIQTIPDTKVRAKTDLLTQLNEIKSTHTMP